MADIFGRHWFTFTLAAQALMRTRLLVLLLLVVALASSLSAQDRRTPKLKAYLRAAAALGQLNGSVLVAENGKILVDSGYGFANMELGVRNTPLTRFRVASVTKQFSGMAAMMLAHDGKLALTDPITKYLDSIPAEWGTITVHDLLRHTSGISDYEEWFDGYNTQAYSDYMSQEHAAARIARDVRTRPLDFPPGSKFHYSNSAYILLGYVIERASGMAFEQFLQQRIMGPLGMTLSTQDRSEVQVANRAQGYRLRPGAMPWAYFKGLTKDDYLNGYYQLMEPPQADAGLITTTRDLYTWDQALYTERLVPKVLLDSIFTPGLGDYGYGWFIRRGPDGVTHEHSGGLPGFTCYIMRIPEHHRTIILLTNTDRLGRTVRDLASIMRGDSVAVPRSRQLLPNDSTVNAAFTGTYRMASGDSLQVIMDGSTLVGWWRDHWRVAFFREAGTAANYFAPNLGSTVRFRDGGEGKRVEITELVGNPLVRAVRAP
ncbi:MAG TPA: serine hydrolase domain-containing protein [Gemmatimonadales bacterium]|nr:serine hydrolase domain-containing protein [Gemmatimonadales bacterium]